MRILIDENLNWRLGRYLPRHGVSSVSQMGWAGKNGELIALAASAFDVFITMDGSIQYQQDLVRFDVIIIGLVVASNRLADTAPLMDQVLEALSSARARAQTTISAPVSR